MKPQLLSSIKSLSSSYGDILYKAWKENLGENNDKEAHNPMLFKIEEIVQGFIHDAIHSSDKKFFRSLRLLLQSFHNAKKSKGVDALLLRIYNPIIWRSLKCANAIVREQSTVLFCDAFPLQNLESSVEENEIILQKQFEMFGVLLKDSDQRVRAAAVNGFCLSLKDYWNIIPTSCTRQNLTFIVSQLAFDSTSPQVRISTVLGLTELLENPLSHSSLKGLLQLLKNVIHDKNDKVRLAFINLLCKVKNIYKYIYN